MQNILQPRRILKRSDKNQVMLIENIDIETDNDGNNVITVSGRDIGCILGQRVVYTRYHVVDEYYPVKMISDIIADNTSGKRAFPNFVVDTSNIEKIELSEKINEQYIGDKLDELLVDICTSYKFGWHVEFDENAASKLTLKFDFKTDKTERVVLSQQRDDVQSVRIYQDVTPYKNVAVVVGERNGKDLSRVVMIEANEPSGWNRFETYIDATDITDNDDTMTDSKYKGLLYWKGINELRVNNSIKSYSDGECRDLPYDATVGSIVTIKNMHGDSGKALILEITDIFDEAGHTIIPTFEMSE